MRLALRTVAATAALICCTPGSPDVPPAPDRGAETAVPPVPPGSQLLSGDFEYTSEHHGYAIRLGLRFEEGVLTRLSQGTATATEVFAIVDDAPGRVVIEVQSDGEPPKRREVVFDGPDVLFDSAAPELRYTRVLVPAAPADGSAAPAEAAATD